jgi:surface antigen
MTLTSIKTAIAKPGKFLIPLVAGIGTRARRLCGRGRQTDRRHAGRRGRWAACSARNSGKGTGKLVGTALGALAGAYLGNQVGQSLDNADRAAMKQSAQYSLEATKVGHTSNWSNPDSGNSGTITPTNTYQAPSGEYCREYQQTVTVGGKTEEAYGTCLPHAGRHLEGQKLIRQARSRPVQTG